MHVLQQVCYNTCIVATMIHEGNSMLRWSFPVGRWEETLCEKPRKTFLGCLLQVPTLIIHLHSTSTFMSKKKVNRWQPEAGSLEPNPLALENEES